MACERWGSASACTTWECDASRVGGTRERGEVRAHDRWAIQSFVLLVASGIRVRILSLHGHIGAGRGFRRLRFFVQKSPAAP